MDNLKVFLNPKTVEVTDTGYNILDTADNLKFYTPQDITDLLVNLTNTATVLSQKMANDQVTLSGVNSCIVLLQNFQIKYPLLIV